MEGFKTVGLLLLFLGFLFFIYSRYDTNKANAHTSKDIWNNLNKLKGKKLQLNSLVRVLMFNYGIKKYEASSYVVAWKDGDIESFNNTATKSKKIQRINFSPKIKQ